MKKIVQYFLPLFITSGIAGVILALLAPLGTSIYSLPNRLIFWIGLCLAGGFGAGLVEALATRMGWSLRDEVIALGQSVGSTLCVSVVLFSFSPPPSFLSLFVSVLYVWLIACVICGVGYLMKKNRTRAVTNSQSDARPVLFDRLPPKLRQSQIYAISAEDHYVRIHTSKGDEMILMRLSDAMKETSPLIGLQTHRSWWVAEEGVASVKKTDGKLTIQLRNKVSAPVSRNKAKDVRQAGWV